MTDATMSSCTQLRRMLITHQSLNLASNETADVGQEWVTGSCDIPLFSEEEVRRGTCRSCANGWTHEHNFPVEMANSTAAG